LPRTKISAPTSRIFLELSVDGQRNAEASAEGEDQFDTFAVDRSECRQRGVVHDPHVTTCDLAQLGLKFVAAPLGIEFGVDVRRDTPGAREVARTHHAAVRELPREANAHAGTLRPFDAFVQRLDQSFGGTGIRGRAPANSFEELALNVDVTELDVGGTNIDGQNLIFDRNSRWSHR
jgi:hypothetical protein